MAMARAVARCETHWCLLYSGAQNDYSGRFSYLCLGPECTLTGKHFSELAPHLTSHHPALENAWFGYLGYKLLHDTESLPCENLHNIATPLFAFSRYQHILVFDHLKQTLQYHAAQGTTPPPWLEEKDPPASPAPPVIVKLTSSMSKSRYLQAVQHTREAIWRGDFYQANITRKFMGEFSERPDPFALFERLCAVSPACYSAFLQMGELSVLSSSPERFLKVDENGEAETRPIKGTAPRMPDAAQDAKARHSLQTSEKDRAENLMIVDLMRNDLARSCMAGSVKVESLFDVSTYATLHHMASTVRGQKREDITTLDLVKHCFPPGSMTGAPKFSAMRWCLEQEQIQRGIYSGALGWFGGDGSCDLSVVIRTLVIEGKRFEFQVGGGIVADSDPEKEWQETLTKAKGIATALGIDDSQLELL